MIKAVQMCRSTPSSGDGTPARGRGSHADDAAALSADLGKTGICYDNAVSESFFATYKKELIHTRPWPDLKSLLEVTVEWIMNYYNTVRRHSTLDYLTPSEYELGFRNLNHLAA